MSSPFNTASGDPKRNGNTPALEPSSVSGLHLKVSNADSSRRSFFKMTIGGAVAGLVTATGMEFAAPRRALAQTALSPTILGLTWKTEVNNN
jgi:hypothetical protein